LSTNVNENEKTVYDKMIMTRLKKIEGQIRGIQKMIEESRSCSDILMQMSAVKSALKKTNYLILKRYANACLMDMNKTEGTEMEEFISTMNEFLSEIEDEFEQLNGGIKDEENT